jgi:hypothetical protein
MIMMLSTTVEQACGSHLGSRSPEKKAATHNYRQAQIHRH